MHNSSTVDISASISISRHQCQHINWVSMLDLKCIQLMYNSSAVVICASISVSCHQCQHISWVSMLDLKCVQLMYNSSTVDISASISVIPGQSSSVPAYQLGNRGWKYESWTSTYLRYADLEAALDYNSTASDYTTSTIDEASYYLEVVHSEYMGRSSFQVAARLYPTTYSEDMTGSAVNEKQSVNIDSTVVHEVQDITPTGFSVTATSYVAEKQTVTISNINANSGVKYRLKLFDAYTDLKTLVSAKAGKESTGHRIDRIDLYRDGDIYVDAIQISNTDTTTDPADQVYLQRQRAAQPLMKAIDVTVPTTGQYRIDMAPNDCANGLPLIGLAGGSPYQQHLLTKKVEDIIRTIPNIGNINVTLDGDCAKFSWKITFQQRRGDQPSFQVNDNKECPFNTYFSI
ncbi:hypothetical protein KUTeg_006181 [Tegillarca granosa]|uniref:Uncharacterized protein n=1 Tax=Tegillarca granosa TaxID=220873 RepID=A0ABQ9FJR1_TEGGR|nr:hypothetical protein KUTeg_006181 [Tegillarca granosa]